VDFINKILLQAKGTKKKVVLPESIDERILKAADILLKQDIAQIIFVGNVERIHQEAKNWGLNIEKAEIYDPFNNAINDRLIESFYEKRKHKGMDMAQAKFTILKSPLYYGAMLVDMGIADAMVAGALCPTADTLRALFHCIGLAEGVSLVSSFFVMISQHKEFGKDGITLFADCAVNPNPTAEQLADIAIDTAKSCKSFLEIEPRVALLSFSTYGSSAAPEVEKVQKALEICKTKAPKFNIDGEMQVDAALIKEIGQRKAKGSPVAGKANCLIFPDLQSGNIGYKLTERFGNVKAVGPILQGAKKPVNDLSRGCSIEDIVNVTALSVIQALNNNQ